MKIMKPKFWTLYFFTYIVTALIMTQQVPYLTQLGYNAFERGLILGACQLSSIVLQLLLGYLCDKYRLHKQLFISTVLISAVGSYIFFTYHCRQLFIHILILFVAGAFINSIYGVQDNWVYSFKGGDEAFSAIRGYGALGWSICAIFVSHLIDNYGYSGLSMTILGAAVLLIVVCLFIPSPKTTPAPIPTSKHEMSSVRISDFVRLFRHRGYFLTVVILLLISFTTIHISYAVIDKMILLGGGTAEVGYKATIHGLVELPFYFLGAKIVKRFGNHKLLLFAAATSTIQFIMYRAFHTLFMMVALTCWQCVTSTSYQIASRNLLHYYSDENLKSTGLLLGISLHVGVAAVIAPIAGGYVTKNFGVDATLDLSIFFGISAILLSVYLMKLEKNKSVSTSTRNE
ncbi:MAG: MFS transporter [Hespellia sp.]|nr:MFS transporter [Hespellia sp.]